MKKEEDLSGSLYLTYDSFHNILHASRQGKGTDGFLRYMHQEMTYVLRGGHNPSVWMASFEFPDYRQIPPITTSNLKSGNYFDRVMEAVELHDGRCRHTVNLWDALFCAQNGIVPLTPQAEHVRLLEHDNYPDPSKGYGTNMPRPHYVLPEYRAYLAVETPAGVVLFSHTEQGRNLRHAYEKFHERNFFNPAQPDGMFRYWEVVADPFKIQDKVDALVLSQQFGEGFEQAYVDRSILRQGHMVREYDLSKNTNNYALFCNRREPDTMPRRKLADMTVKELFHHFVHALLSREKSLGYTDNRLFPGEKPQTSYKLRNHGL